MRTKYQMNDKILATVTRAFSPRLAGYSNHYAFTITAEAYQLGGNQHPHFSVTVEVTHKASGSMRAGGCMHDEALKAWPAIAPIVALHLCNADDGEPSGAEENGFYKLAGAVSHHFGQKYHAGSSPRNFPIVPDPATPWKNTEHRNPTEAECLCFLADHLRITPEAAAGILSECRRVYAAQRDADDSLGSMEGTEDITPNRAATEAAREIFRAFVDLQRPRWKKEAAAGIALIKSLANKVQKAA